MQQGWRIIRVFISSTFRDMQAERDHLVRFVFPRLREKLLKRRMHLVDVDLRWGVTSEHDALEVCQDIIDECRPRFLCILGGRYGWVPPGQEHSITAAEIHYALHQPHTNQYQFFYFRDPSSTAAIPEVAVRAGGYREFPLSEEVDRLGIEQAEILAQQRTKKLEELKQEIVVAGYAPFIYPARWDNNVQRLVALEAFGDRIYSDLMGSINDEFGAESPELQDEFAAEHNAQEAFIEERVAGYVVGDRQELFTQLLNFARGANQPNLLVISGSPGSGKTALLGKFYQDYIRTYPNDLVLYHFVGASVGSSDLRRSLRRWCFELSNALDSQEEIPQDIQDVRHILAGLLEKIAPDQRIVFILDALNQFDPTDNPHTLQWLPRNLPSLVRIVVSTLDHPVLENLRQRHDVMEKQLKPLNLGHAHTIIENFLRRYRKQMTSEQIAILQAKPGSGNPLYLLTALEELRTLGTYEEITERIQALPGEAGPLFQWIFQERLSRDPGFRDEHGKAIGSELVRQFASLLGASRYGLSQQELAELLAPGDPRAKPPVPADHLGNVAALLRLLRSYLMYRGELLDFFHGQVREAAVSGFLNDEIKWQVAHHQLAEYFQDKADPFGNQLWQAEDIRGFSELPYHLKASGQLINLRCLLLDFSWLESKLRRLDIQTLINDYNLLSGDPVLEMVQEALSLSAHVLSVDKTHLASQLKGRLLGQNIPEIKALLVQTGERQTGVWLLPLTPSLQPPGGPLVRTLSGHTSWVKAVAVTKDGQRAISASADKTLKLWDLESGYELATLKGHSDEVWAVALTPDGQRAISASRDNTLKLWDLESEKELLTLSGHLGWVNGVAVTKDGQRAISASADKTLKLWDLESGYELATLKGHSDEVWAVALSPDDLKAVSASNDQSLIVWDLLNATMLLRINNFGRGNTVALTPDGQRIIVGTNYNNIEIFELHGEKSHRTLRGHKSSVWAVAVTHDGETIISGSLDNTLNIWDFGTGKLLKSFRGHGDGVRGVAITQDDHLVLSASDDHAVKVWQLGRVGGDNLELAHTGKVEVLLISPEGKRCITSCDKIVKILDLEKIDRLSSFIGHDKGVTSVIVTPDGHKAICGSQNGRMIKIWHLENNIELETINAASNINKMTITPDGCRLACVNMYDFQLINIESKQARYVRRAHRGWIRALVLTPNGELAITASEDHTVKLWDTMEGRERLVFTEHRGEVIAIAVMPDSRHAVSASKDKTIKIWDLKSGNVLQTLEVEYYGASSLAVTPDGRKIVACDLSFLKVWDLECLSKPKTLLHDHNIYEVKVSLDGRQAVSVSDDNILKVWDLGSGDVLASFRGDGPLNKCAIAPNGVSLLAGGPSGEVHILHIDGVEPGPPITTAWFDQSRCRFGVGCPLCRKWFNVQESELGSLLNCSNCNKPLKINPFTINADWQPVARAWRGGTD